MVLIPVQGLQGGIGVKHAATAGTEDIPGHLECPKPSGVEECGDCLLLVQAVVGCERESINAVQVAICAVLNEVSEAMRDLWSADCRKAVSSGLLSLIAQFPHLCAPEEGASHLGRRGIISRVRDRPEHPDGVGHGRLQHLQIRSASGHDGKVVNILPHRVLGRPDGPGPLRFGASGYVLSVSSPASARSLNPPMLETDL